MTAVELLPPGTGSHDEQWHQLRREGVTASEIAVVMGISPYDSPFSLYWAKVNDWRWDGNELTGTGSHLEPSIADWWMAACDPLENLAMRPAGLYAHRDRPWQLATPDRLLYLTCACCADGGCTCGLSGNCSECYNTGFDGPPVALLECKWVAHSWDGWGEPGTDEIPVHYRAQELWQADVLGVSTVYTAALGPTGFRSYVVHVDDAARADLEVMRAAGAAFALQVHEGHPPDLNGHDATISALQRLHPVLGEGDLEVSLDLAERYRSARLDRKNAEKRVAECEAEIRALLGSEYSRLVCNKRLVASRSIFERRSDDENELMAIDDAWPTTDRLNPGQKLETPYA